ncbi:hypothetical protein LCGC14_0439120 [marine sediment metagenome]|uniref:Uncharacterized protein n=1 Tax=marine sediment metagenome TaxID=412755 RepID=A0A0F9SRR6_9ZZZZ
MGIKIGDVGINLNTYLLGFIIFIIFEYKGDKVGMLIVGIGTFIVGILISIKILSKDDTTKQPSKHYNMFK